MLGPRLLSWPIVVVLGFSATCYFYFIDEVQTFTNIVGSKSEQFKGYKSEFVYEESSSQQPSSSQQVFHVDDLRAVGTSPDKEGRSNKTELHLAPRVPLSNLIRDKEKGIIGDVQSLLDFAFIGHHGTAESPLYRWLKRSSEVQMLHSKVFSLQNDKPAELVNSLYTLPEGNYKRGMVAPNAVRFNTSLANIHKFWPKTRLIVGLRHPVEWFESFFRSDMEAAKNLIGAKFPTQVNYHVNLNRMGKTKGGASPSEAKLLSTLHDFKALTYPKIPNPVFLYDVSQPFDKTERHRKEFQRDLESFLELSEPLNLIKIRNNTETRLSGSKRIICEKQFDRVRMELMMAARSSSEWLREYFIKHPDVTVSSPQRFEEILKSWNLDPCDTLRSFNESQVHVSEADGYPPIDELVGDNDIKQDVQFLLDFAIVGHAKTATSSMMRWLSTHEEVLIYQKEMHYITKGSPAKFVKYMYMLPHGSRYKRGYKSPNELTFPTPRALIREYFPKTKLIVGLRHPVKWFESYYNFNTRMGGGHLKPPEELLGSKLPTQVRFHTHLAMMGKTNLNASEMELLSPFLEESVAHLKRMRNPVFLYEVSQPFDSNETRNQIFRDDLQKFIGLGAPLNKLVERTVSKNSHKSISICDDKWVTLRADLLRLGKAASVWIRTYFISLGDVTVSSPEHFEDLLSTWEFDPCIKL